MLKNKKLITPSLSESCVAGTMRKVIIEIARTKNFEISEETIPITNLELADEVWLTNAIQGIQWVGSFKNHTFENIVAKDFVQFLNEKLSAI